MVCWGVSTAQGWGRGGCIIIFASFICFHWWVFCSQLSFLLAFAFLFSFMLYFTVELNYTHSCWFSVIRRYLWCNFAKLLGFIFFQHCWVLCACVLEGKVLVLSVGAFFYLASGCFFICTYCCWLVVIYRYNWCNLGFSECVLLYIFRISLVDFYFFLVSFLF